MEWAENSYLFYTVPDALGRPWQVKRHRLGMPVAADVTVFEEPDPRFFVDLKQTKDKVAWPPAVGSERPDR